MKDRQSRRLAGQRPCEPSGNLAQRWDWFADEIAIDFPSIGPVVDRIREAFLGDDDMRGTLSAEVRLSARDAFVGATIPLEVPLRSTCSPCGGRGEIWSERCGACDGAGHTSRRHQVRLSLPARVTDGARFRFSIVTPQAPPTLVEVRVAIEPLNTLTS